MAVPLLSTLLAHLASARLCCACSSPCPIRRCRPGSDAVSADCCCGCRTRFMRIARRNLELCFPELLGGGARSSCWQGISTASASACSKPRITWWSPAKRHAGDDGSRRTRASRSGARRGRGAILLSAHFTTLEIGARAICAPASDQHHVPADEECGARTLPEGAIAAGTRSAPFRATTSVR